MRTRIKVCGITQQKDLNLAVKLGADAIGLIFYEGSKRCVSLEQAKHLRQSVPAFVSVVALFVNAKPEFVRQVIKQVQPDILQFHGDETPTECEQYGHRYMRAFRVGGLGMNTPQLVLEQALKYNSASAWLFDTYTEQYGGSGKTFNHELLSAVLQSNEDFSQSPNTDLQSFEQNNVQTRHQTQAKPIGVVTKNDIAEQIAGAPNKIANSGITLKPVILAGGLRPENIESIIKSIKPYAIDVSSGVESAPGIKSATLLQQFMQIATSINH